MDFLTRLSIVTHTSVGSVAHKFPIFNGLRYGMLSAASECDAKHTFSYPTTDAPIRHIAASLLNFFLVFSVAGILVGPSVLPAIASSDPNQQMNSPLVQAQDSAIDAASTPRKQTAKGASSVKYLNTKYGFCSLLPEGWTGYSIVLSEWHVYTQWPQGDTPVAQGPIIAIRHPKWTPEDPRQDIPIMVITRQQWRLLEHGKFLLAQRLLTRVNWDATPNTYLPCRRASTTHFQPVTKRWNRL